MSPKERVIKALKHEEPDRVPTGEIGVDYPVTERVLGRQTFYRAKWKEMTALWEGRRDEVVESYKRDIVELALKLEWDFVPVFLVPPKGRAPKKPRFLDEYTWEDDSGRVWQFSPVAEGHPICIRETEVGIDDITIPDRVAVEESQLELVRHVVKELGKTHFILGRGGDGTYPQTGGTLAYLMKMADEPAFVRKATRAATRRAIEEGKTLIGAGCDAILMATDYCDNRGPMMSPRHFKEYIAPSLAEHCQEFHRAGAWVIKHTDGNTWPILDMMMEAGIDGLQGIQPSAGMDMKELKAKVGDRLCLWGAIDCDLLVRGTEAEVAREVEYDVQNAGVGGGLVLVSGNTITTGAKFENYMAMLRAVKEKGRYPIRG